MEIGKLPNDVLKNVIISKIDRRNKDILVGPEVGEDCSIVDFGDEVCVLTTDPVTAASKDAGTIGVHICCNDIASAGVRPLGILVTILAPPSSSLGDIKEIMEQVNGAAEELSIDVLGGHTEVTDAVNRLVLSITAIGKGKKNEFVTTGGSKIGDDIVVTGFAGLEGTAIIARDYYDKLAGKIDEGVLIRAQGLLKSISVVRASEIASKFGVNAMHDATEGGILGAVWEVAEASGKGVIIFKDKIPLKDETILISREAQIDPYRLISSGSMIISCSDGEGLVKVLKESNIDAAVVGRIVEDKKVIVAEGIETPLAPPESDEIYRVKL